MPTSDDKKSIAIQEQLEEQPDKGLWRDLVAFWILGLGNNFGYVVMLSAAHDIVARFNGGHSVEHPEASSTQRQCNITSTGAILLADVIPSFLVKTLIPFIPLWVNFRIFTSIAFGITGFVVVAYASVEEMAILGVICTSTACGIGESTFLSYSSKFNRNVLSTWSSGTGGAGIIGSLTYAGLCSLGLSSKNIMLIMLIFPGIESVAFWLLLRQPNASIGKVTSNLEDDKPVRGFKDTIVFISTLCKYMIPLMTVYLFEYFINQGLFELVHFKDTFLDKDAQYRWLCVDYQIGVFIARSSVNLIHIRRIWILSALQLINMVYFLNEVIFYITPSIWITFLVVLCEGLLGGGAYVNTFYRISIDITRPRQEFALGITAQADAVGIMLAGFMAIPAHNAICKLPAPERTSGIVN